MINPLNVYQEVGHSLRYGPELIRCFYLIDVLVIAYVSLTTIANHANTYACDEATTLKRISRMISTTTLICQF